MISRKTLFTFYALLSVLISIAQSKKPSKINLASQYDPKAHFWSTLYLVPYSNDTNEVFVKILLNSAQPDVNKLLIREEWKIEYSLCASYDTKKKILTNQIFCKSWIKDEQNVWLKFKIPSFNLKSSYLFIILYDLEDKPIVLDACLSYFNNKLQPKLYLTDNTGIIPWLESYAQVGQEVIIRSKNRIALNYLKYLFQPALPPMSDGSLYEENIKLISDSNWISSDSILTFDKKGIYCFDDLEKNDNRCIVVFENKFPKLTKARELADPLVYISSDDERRIIRNAQIPKLKLDDFWLNLGLEKDVTKKNIKAYYNGVERANRFFTTYKEGWKTDRGIIYIIFGPPNEVYKSDSKETWYYERTSDLPARKIVYRKKLGPLNHFVFELERSQDYNNIYQYLVELWRKGQLTE